MDIDARIALFRDMILCCHELYLWTYDSGFHLTTSNCPDQTVLNELFAASQRQVEFDREISASPLPIIFTNEIGMMWVMVPQIEADELLRLYVLGPFLIDDISPQELETQLHRHELSFSLHKSFLHFLHKLPVISLNRIFEYAIMLYFCVTEKKISVSDLRYHKQDKMAAENIPQRERIDFHGTYKGEQEMLRMVREGDLHYRTQVDKLSITGHRGKMGSGTSLRQFKNTLLAGITLFCRAAMEGGLAPEIAYTLADHYIQSVEACASMADLVELAHTAEDDYVRRVHRCRTSGLSPQIQASCEYIELHLEDKMLVSDLARRAGYSAFYFGRKFQQELSMTPNEYIRRKRLEYAAMLLRTTQEDVQDIAAKLQFCSHSYFADSFRKLYGLSPSEYRQRKENI